MAINWEQNENFSFTMIAPNKVKLSATGSIPIYTDECLDMARFSMEIPNKLFDKIADEMSIDMILLYSDGKNEFHISNETVRKRLISFN